MAETLAELLTLVRDKIVDPDATILPSASAILAKGDMAQARLYQLLSVRQLGRIRRLALLDIPALTTSVPPAGGPPALPADLVEPINVWEKADGAPSSTWTEVSMSATPILLSTDQPSASIGLWWYGAPSTLFLRPCMTARDLALEYDAQPAAFTVNAPGNALAYPGTLAILAADVAYRIADQLGLDALARSELAERETLTREYLTHQVSRLGTTRALRNPPPRLGRVAALPYLP